MSESTDLTPRAKGRSRLSVMAISPASKPPSCGGQADCLEVLFCVNPDYLQHMTVALVSLLKNNPLLYVRCHLVLSSRDNALENLLHASVLDFQNVDLVIYDFKLQSLGDVPIAWHITKDTYVRLFATSIIGPGIDKILYLDADVIVLGDLRPLWRTSIDQFALAGVPDVLGASRLEPLGLPANATYVNAGVMLINLRFWRDNNITSKIHSLIGAYGDRLTWHDQDAINIELHGAIKVLSSGWNCQIGVMASNRSDLRLSWWHLNKQAKEARILHYSSSRKPWQFSEAVPKKSIYFRYLRKTSFSKRQSAGSLLQIPELLFNWVAMAIGINWTLQRFMRSTLAGRALGKAWALCLGRGLRQSV